MSIRLAALVGEVKTGICSGCDFVSRSCKRPHPSDCSRYIQCMEQEGKVVAVEFYCSWGLHWDETTSTCDWPSKVGCKNDPCKNPGSPPHPYGGNCRGYWECNGSYSEAKCCPAGQSFSSMTGCTVDPKCDVNIPCFGIYKSAPLSTTTPTADCPYRQADPSGNTFIGRGTLVVLSCGTGKVFNETHCACIQVSNETSVCSPRVDLEFIGNEVRDLTTRATSYSLSRVDGKGVFLGSSSVGLWEFDGAPLGEHIEIRLKFLPFPGGPVRQVVASNCKTMGSNEPSIAIEIDRPTSMIYFKGVTDSGAANISVPFTTRVWNEVTWSLVNETLVGTQEIGGVKSENSAVLKGFPKIATSPFKVGACKDTIDGFYGLIDRVTYYDCDSSTSTTTTTPPPGV